MLWEDIEGTKDNIEYQVIGKGKPVYFGVPFSKYQKVYATSNENLEGYITKDNIEGKTNINLFSLLLLNTQFFDLENGSSSSNTHRNHIIESSDVTKDDLT